MESAWTGPPVLAGTLLASLASLAMLAMLAVKVLLNASRKVKSLRAKVKFCKEVGHLNKVWSIILQGTLVGHLKSIMLKDLQLKGSSLFDLT